MSKLDINYPGCNAFDLISDYDNLKNRISSITFTPINKTNLKVNDRIWVKNQIYEITKIKETKSETTLFLNYVKESEV